MTDHKITRRKIRPGTVRVNPTLEIKSVVSPPQPDIFKVMGTLKFTVLSGEITGLEFHTKTHKHPEGRIATSVLSKWAPNVAYSLDPKRVYPVVIHYQGTRMLKIVVTKDDRDLTFQRITV